MARLEDRLPENAAGDWFVDSSCIDCDTCRFVAPSVFARSPARDTSIVTHQPQTPEERLRAASLWFESSTCGDAWIRWSGGATLLDVAPHTAADFLRASAPGLSRDTADRRAQTLASWHRALSPHHYRRGNPPE